MSKRDLKSIYNVDTSQLARFYEEYHRKIYNNTRIRVYKKVIPDFLEFEKLLRSKGISCRDYTETVLRLLQAWAEDKGMDFVPIPTFLSTFGLGRYMSVADSSTVEIIEDDLRVELLHSEVMVGRVFISNYLHAQGNYKFKDAVEEIEPILSSSWLELYESGDRGDIVDDTVKLLAGEYGVDGCGTYADIVDSLI